MVSQKATSIIIISAICAILSISCSRQEQKEQLTSSNGENFDSYFADEQQTKENQNDRLRNEIGRLFLVEYSDFDYHESMKKALAFHPPAGLYFQGNKQVSYTQVQDLIHKYSEITMQAHRRPLLMALDSQLGMFSGLSHLVNGYWLGKIAARQGYEICHLHAEILVDELLATGINAPFSLAADLVEKEEASFAHAASSEVATKCMQEMMQVFSERKKIVMLGQHFPGESLSSYKTSLSATDINAVIKQKLQVFMGLFDFVKARGATAQLAVVVGDAKLPIIDTKNRSLFSEPLLKNLLRDKLQFRGLAISDRMWTGEYQKMSIDQVLPLYVKSILSGVDVLFVSGSKFAPAVQYFRRLYDSQLTDAENYQLESTVKMSSAEIRQALKIRISEILERLQPTQKALGHSLPVHVDPKKQSQEAVKRYQEILQDNYFTSNDQQEK